MKHSRLLSVLILIVLVFLLSDARKGNAQPSPRGVPASHRSATTEQKPARHNTNDHHHPRRYISTLSSIARDRATQDRTAAESAQHAAEQEAYLNKQEELAATTLAVTQQTLDITRQSLGIDWWLVKLTAALAIINVLTMGVFYFTMQATFIAANATKNSADAALAASTAYIHLMRVSLEGQIPNHDIMEGWLGVADPVFHYGFTNFGKSPAYMSEMCWEHYFGQHLPDTPIYENRGPLFELFVIPAERDFDLSHPWSRVFDKYPTKYLMEDERRPKSW